MKVLIINPNHEYENMFILHGWELATSVDEADLVQFTGGSDVSPDFYKCHPHPATQNNQNRDRRERKVFNYCLKNKKKMAGICRGGQFLNVMCGGSMWQHVPDHTLHGFHKATDLVTSEVIDVTSTHHQMMRPSSDGKIILAAYLTPWRETASSRNNPLRVYNHSAADPDVEAVWYEKQNVFCFQPHPEFSGAYALSCKYMDYLQRYLFNN